MDLLSAWRTATSAAHKQLESDLNLLRPDWTIPEYVQLLQGYYGFFRAFEDLLQTHPDLPAAKFYVPDRLKTKKIRDDLRHFQFSETQIEALPRAALPANWIESPAALWGCLYTVEGSMLGGRMLVKHFGQNLQLAGGLKFYEGYGADTMPRWQSFLALVKALDLNSDEFSAAVASASETFGILGSQLMAANKFRHGS